MTNWKPEIFLLSIYSALYIWRRSYKKPEWNFTSEYLMPVALMLPSVK